MNKNLFANMKAYADCKRNAFPLDNKHTYTQKLGEITPVKCLHTLPDDYMEVTMGEKDISFPLNTSAFLSARKEFSVYHVPYNHVFSLFNQLQASRPDPKTSALVQSDEVLEIGMPLYHLYLSVYGAWLNAVLIDPLLKTHDIDYHNQNPVLPYLTLSSSLYDGLGGYDLVLTKRVGLGGSITFPNAIVGTSVHSAYFTKDLLDFCLAVEHPEYVRDMHHRWAWCGMCRKLDNLGYGNLYPILHTGENMINEIEVEDANYESKVANIINRTFWNVVDLAFSEIYFDCVGGKGSVLYPTEHEAIPYVLDLYPILSYNKIFYTYMRNSVYDLDYSPKNFSMDFYYTDGENPTQMSITDFPRRFLFLEYHQYKKDIFSGSFPTPQFGAVVGITTTAVLSVLTDNNSSYTGSSSGTILEPDGVASFDRGQLSFTYDSNLIDAKHHHNGSASGTINLFNVLDLRRAEMLQNYRQTLLRNGNKTADIFKGIYGKAPASEDDNAPRFIDTFGSSVFVDTIVSTADTATEGSYKGALGDLGARATIGLGGKFKFKTSDFGCLIFLSYIVPENEYGSTMLDNNLTALDPESHMLPFFQNLGFQPVHNYNLSLYAAEKNSVRGYAPSYWDKKQELSIAHGAFVSVPASRLLVNLDASNFNNATRDPNGREYVGSFNHWVVLRTATQMAKTATLAQFYVSPALWDNVFLQKVTDDYESDHFICRFAIDVKSVRILSKLGLPNF